MDFYEKYDTYLSERTGCYDWRAIRYRSAAEMLKNLEDTDTVFDLGAGWTEFDYTLRVEFDWKGRYVPIDGAIAPVDLNTWVPTRPTEHTVALEILEHLEDPERLVHEVMEKTKKTVVVSVPNPETVDIFEQDETHCTEVTREMLTKWGFTVTDYTLYGGVFSNGKPDALMGVWTP